MVNMVTLTTSNFGTESFVQLITVFIIFVFVLALTFFATKFVGNYQKTKLAGNNIQVLETFRISNSKYLQIIKIGEKHFAISVCKDTITYLGDLNAEDLVFRDSSKEFKLQNFKDILDKFKKDKPED